MTPRAKTIQIFLPAGDPRGIRIAEITTRIVQVIEVPRSLLPEFLAMPESTQVAVYFLVGQTEDSNEEMVYVGQTGDLRARLVDHNRKKDFWERALVLISRTQSLTQTHALFLESFCLQEIRRAARYRDDNGNGGNRPHTPPPLEADCFEIFETGQALVSTLGYRMFDPVATATSGGAATEVFVCTAGDVDGRGLYTSEGFVVLKGSRGRKKLASETHGSYHVTVREELLAAGVISINGDSIQFLKDHLFKTPSGAAVALLGRRANGWTEWKTPAGQTLDAVKRAKVSE